MSKPVFVFMNGERRLIPDFILWECEDQLARLLKIIPVGMSLVEFLNDQECHLILKELCPTLCEDIGWEWLSQLTRSVNKKNMEEKNEKNMRCGRG